MITTKQYRTVFNSLAAKYGVDWLGTWTDDVRGRGYTVQGELLRTVTHEIGRIDNDPKALAKFVKELHRRVGPESNVRLTSYYIKATVQIHDDLWHNKEPDTTDA